MSGSVEKTSVFNYLLDMNYYMVRWRFFYFDGAFVMLNHNFFNLLRVDSTNIKFLFTAPLADPLALLVWTFYLYTPRITWEDEVERFVVILT